MGVYQREGSPNWWLRYRDAGGKLIRRSAQTTLKSVALAQLAEAEAAVIEAIAEKADPASSDITYALPASESLEDRIEALETVVRRLLLEKQVQIRFLKAWARSSKRLLSG